METAEPELLYEGEYLRLLRRGHWEYAERVNARGAVIIVAVTPDDRVLFVEQYRIPLQAPSIEMPAGLVGDVAGEDSFEAAARRELLEETGWHAGTVEMLMRGPTSSGLTNETVAFVRARDLRRVHAGGGDPSEDIVVHEIPRAEAAAWLAAKMREGYAMDAKLWAGLWLIDHEPDGSPVSPRPKTIVD